MSTHRRLSGQRQTLHRTSSQTAVWSLTPMQSSRLMPLAMSSGQQARIMQFGHQLLQNSLQMVWRLKIPTSTQKGSPRQQAYPTAH